MGSLARMLTVLLFINFISQCVSQFESFGSFGFGKPIMIQHTGSRQQVSAVGGKCRDPTDGKLYKVKESWYKNEAGQCQESTCTKGYGAYFIDNTSCKPLTTTGDTGCPLVPSEGIYPDCCQFHEECPVTTKPTDSNECKCTCKESGEKEKSEEVIESEEKKKSEEVIESEEKKKSEEVEKSGEKKKSEEMEKPVEKKKSNEDSEIEEI